MSKKSEDTLKIMEDWINNLTKDELENILKEAEVKYENSWLPENQNAYHICMYCGKDSHMILCNDLVGRSFCPECRDRAEKEFIG